MLNALLALSMLLLVSNPLVNAASGQCQLCNCGANSHYESGQGCGTARCACDANYILDGSSCVCNPATGLALPACTNCQTNVHLQQSTGLNGIPVCSCQPGYVPNNNANNLAAGCPDCDPTKENVIKVAQDCVCKPGYMFPIGGSIADGCRQCLPDSHLHLVNIGSPSFACSCEAGYVTATGSTTDIGVEGCQHCSSSLPHLQWNPTTKICECANGYSPPAGVSNPLLSANANLVSASNLILHQRVGGHIEVTAPSTWSAKSHVYLWVGVMASTAGAFSIVADSSSSGSSGSLQFGASSNITVGLPALTSITFTSYDVIWNSNFKLSGASSNIVFDTSKSLKPAYFGGASDFGFYHVKQSEMASVTTTGSILLGSTNAETIIVNALDRASRTESSLVIKATSLVQFSTGTSTINSALDILSHGHVVFATNLIVAAGAGLISVMADVDINGTGAFTLLATASLSLTALDFKVSAADVVIVAGATVSAGTTNIYFSCYGTRPLRFGDSDQTGSGHMDITSAEAALVTTSSSWTLTSKTITIRGVSSGVTDGAVELNARVSPGGTITFTGASSFDSLNATAADGIVVSAVITTTVGQLALDADYDLSNGGRTVLSANANLVVYTNLILHQRVGGHIEVTAPSTWSAKGHVFLWTGVMVSAASTFSIIADSGGTGSSGALQFGTSSNITVGLPALSSIAFTSYDVIWNSNFKLSGGSSDIVFDTSKSLKPAYFGGASDFGFYHVKQSEMASVTTTGRIYLGSTNAETIIVNALDRASRTESSLVIKATVWIKQVKIRMGLDDALDVCALQGVPGVIGTMLVSIGAPGYPSSELRLRLVGVQFLACILTIVWAAFWTFLLMRFIKATVGINVDIETEEIGLDLVQVGEQAYDETLAPILDLGPELLTARLCDAAMQDDLARIRLLIDGGADPELADYDQRTPIHIASACGHLRIVQFLHGRCRVSINVTDRFGNTPLADALAAGHSDVIAYLEKEGGTLGEHLAAMSPTDASGDLIQAAANGKYDEVRLRLRMGGVPVNGKDYDGRTALHVASAENHPKIVKLLLESGADRSARDRWDQTPLHDSIRFRHSQITKLLLTKDGGGSSSRDRRTSSSISSRQSRHSFSESLRSPLLVDQDHHSEVVEVFEEPDIAMEIARFPKFENTSGRALVKAASEGDLAEYKLLIAKGASAESTDYDGRTSLHLSACNGHLNLVKYLVVEVKANVNCYDRFGKTPLQDAISFGHVEVVIFLRRNGAIVSEPAAARKLCWAAASGDLDQIKLLSASGTDLNTADYDG